MQKVIAFIIIVLLAITGFRYYQNSKPKHLKLQKETKKDKKIDYKNLELSYIIDVINNGSNRLNFPDSPMEGGYVPKDKAKDVACYILKLRNKPCKDGFSKDAPLFYSSNCSGCHGIDAKGIKGSYPSLLNKEFKGLKIWLNEK
jgi:cytochrome c553